MGLLNKFPQDNYLFCLVALCCWHEEAFHSDMSLHNRHSDWNVKCLAQRLRLSWGVRIFPRSPFVCREWILRRVEGQSLSLYLWCGENARTSHFYSLIGTPTYSCAVLTHSLKSLSGVLQKISSISSQLTHTLAASAIVQACSPLIEDLGGWLVYGWLSTTQRPESPACEKHFKAFFWNALFVLIYCPSNGLPHSEPQPNFWCLFIGVKNEKS